MMRWMRCAVGLMRKRVNWVLDADIRGFFDTMDHEWLMQVRRASDRGPTDAPADPEMAAGGRIGGREWSETEVGTPQGAVISPLLANIYLHYVFDLWVQQWRTAARDGRGDRGAIRG